MARNDEFLDGLEAYGEFCRAKIPEDVKDSINEVILIREGATYGTLTELLRICKRQYEYNKMMEGVGKQ